MSRAFKDFSYLTVGNLLIKFLGILSIVVYTRYLDKIELAVLPAFALLGRLSIVVFGFGILPWLVREIPSYMKSGELNKVKSILRTSIIIVFPGVFLFSLLCAFLAEFIAMKVFHADEFAEYIPLLSIAVFFEGISQLLSQIYWSLSMFKQESTRMIVVGLVRIILGVILILFYGVYGLLLGLIISSLLNVLIYITSLRGYIFGKGGYYSGKKIISTSWPYYLESYILYLRSEGDQLIVTAFLGAESLAVYYIARRPYDIAKTFTRSLDRVLTANLAQSKKYVSEFNARISKIFLLNTYVITPLIFFLIGLAPVLIILIAGQEYSQAVFPAILLLLMLLVEFHWNSTWGRSLFILKSSLARFRLTITETLILLSTILILVHYADLIGIVIGRLVASTITGYVAYRMMRKEIKVNIAFKSALTVLLISIVSSSILLLGQYFFPSVTSVIITIVLSILIFLVLINLLISKEFYENVNHISPIRIKDPIKIILG